MAYILAVHPSLLSQTGMDANALFTTTILSAAIATLLMALYAKLPFALAPSMGVNAFFVYTIVMVMGYSWSFALTGHASGNRNCVEYNKCLRKSLYLPQLLLISWRKQQKIGKCSIPTSLSIVYF